MEPFTALCLAIACVYLFSGKKKEEDYDDEDDDEITFSIKENTSDVEKIVKQTKNNSNVKIEDVSDGEMEFKLNFPMEQEKLDDLYNSLRKANQFRAIDAIKTMEVIFNNLCLVDECKDIDEAIKKINKATQYAPQWKTIHVELYEQHRLNYLKLLFDCNFHVLNLYQEKYDIQTNIKTKQEIKQKMKDFLAKCITNCEYGYYEYQEKQKEIERNM